jgi:GTP-binding protein Era
MNDVADTRFGIFALAGVPNAGKSSLLNAVVGDKLAITSAKPQSTRHPVTGIVTEGNVQLVFIDPPGLFDPHDLLQSSMVETALRTLRDADGVLYLHSVTQGVPPPLEAVCPRWGPRQQPLATVLTKADLADEDTSFATGPATFVVSAKTGQGIPQLLAWCRHAAPPGPFHHDPESLSTQHLRFFAAELVRETAFELLQQELPYALNAEVDEFRESAAPVYIRVVLYVERASQKGMVIGKHGATIKALGQLARQKIEVLLGEHVYLDLWVKVLPRWRRTPEVLKRLGLAVPMQRQRSR